MSEILNMEVWREKSGALILAGSPTLRAFRRAGIPVICIEHEEI